MQDSDSTYDYIIINKINVAINQFTVVCTKPVFYRNSVRYYGISVRRPLALKH